MTVTLPRGLHAQTHRAQATEPIPRLQGGPAAVAQVQATKDEGRGVWGDHGVRLSGVDVGALADGGWNALLGDLYFAVFGEERRVFKQDAFHFAATRAGIRDAQGGLRIHLPVLQRGKGEEPAPKFQLSAYWLYVAADKDGFVSRPAFTEGPTMIYFTLASLLERTRVT